MNPQINICSMQQSTITVVQSRMSSTRFPGKVMKDVLGKTLLERMLERMSFSKKCGTIVVATSTNPNDDALESLCKKIDIPCFRGNEEDLLERHYLCAKAFGAKVVAKIPSDCPLIDPTIMDKGFDYFFDNDFDFISNLHPASYPDGNDVEVFSFEALEKAFLEATKKMEREHTTPYFWENPDKFKIGNFKWEKELDYSMSHRFTIDYEEDYFFIKTVFEKLYPSNPQFGLEEILNLLEISPEIYELNAKFAGVNWYRNHLDELKTIDASKTKKI
jgi:spore coat polysaccharide biosynthesis protein SpsF